jgi:hypothetical protein
MDCKSNFLKPNLLTLELMVTAKTILAATVLVLSQAALANNEPQSCSAVKPYKAFSGKVPKTFRLLPPCRNASGPNNYDNDYSFIGQATISGAIRYEETVTFGPWATFIADEKSKALLPDDVFFFDLDRTANGNQAAKEFRIPKLHGRGKNCWTTTATMLINDISSVNDGTDNTGNSLGSYKVLSVGKYKKCQAETDDVPE